MGRSFSRHLWNSNVCQAPDTTQPSPELGATLAEALVSAGLGPNLDLHTQQAMGSRET